MRIVGGVHAPHDPADRAAELAACHCLGREVRLQELGGDEEAEIREIDVGNGGRSSFGPYPEAEQRGAAPNSCPESPGPIHRQCPGIAHGLTLAICARSVWDLAANGDRAARNGEQARPLHVERTRG